MTAEGLVSERTRGAGGFPVYVVRLPYTRPPLSMNDRHHWRKDARIKRAVRGAVATSLRALTGAPSAVVPHIHVSLHYVPRDRRVRDADNATKTLKPCLDAMTKTSQDRGWAATPLVQDDSPEYVCWTPPKIHEPDRDGARVWLRVECMARCSTVS